jgi:hypothetical protein
MRIWFVILVVGMQLGAGVKVSSATDRMAFGEGVSSCGAWTQERKRDTQRAQMQRAWVLGFVSGADVYEGLEFLRQTDADAILAWVDNYCGSYPLERIYDAAIKLVEELIRRAQRTGPQ